MKETIAVKYPEITVKLLGEDGNAMLIVGRVREAMRRAGVAPGEIEEYSKAAKSGYYDHLLQVTMQTVNVE